MLHSSVRCSEIKFWSFIKRFIFFIRFDIAFHERLTFNSNQQRTVNGNESLKNGATRHITQLCLVRCDWLDVGRRRPFRSQLFSVYVPGTRPAAAQTTPPDWAKMEKRFWTTACRRNYLSKLDWRTGCRETLLWAYFVGRGMYDIHCTGPPKHAGNCQYKRARAHTHTQLNKKVKRCEYFPNALYIGL